MDLPTLWFLLVGILFTGYVILDGFDLGVGALHLFSKTDVDRRLLLNAIGPVWDGNEVWLVTGGGALFGAFPHAYATAFSTFYIPFTLLLCTLIFRAVAIEFRSKSHNTVWRKTWDMTFAIASVGSAFLIGVAIANIVIGIPLDKNYEYLGRFQDFLNPYALWVGLTTVLLFATHGAIYLVLKTEGHLQKQAKIWAKYSTYLFLTSYIIFNLLSVNLIPHIAYTVQTRPWIRILVIINILCFLALPYLLKKNREGIAFMTSCIGIGLIMSVLACTLYPKLIVSYPDIHHTLTIYNASSSTKTLSIMAIIAAIGTPLVISYTICIYWIFRGKVILGKNSY